MESGCAIREAQGARDSFKRDLSDIQKFSSLFSVLFLSFCASAKIQSDRTSPDRVYHASPNVVTRLNAFDALFIREAINSYILRR